VEDALTESEVGWEPCRTQSIKWTAEGMVKGFGRVFHDVTTT